MNACSLHALYMKESAVAKNARGHGMRAVDVPWTKNGENASVSFPYPTCFFIMG